MNNGPLITSRRTALFDRVDFRDGSEFGGEMFVFFEFTRRGKRLHCPVLFPDQNDQNFLNVVGESAKRALGLPVGVPFKGEFEPARGRECIVEGDAGLVVRFWRAETPSDVFDMREHLPAARAH